MKPAASSSGVDPAAEIPRLIETLLATERRLVELTAGEVDAVAGRDGRTFLLQRAQEHLRQNEAAKQDAILNALPAHIALLDAQGLIISVNDAWRQFGRSGGLASQQQGEGLDYLAICEGTEGPGAKDAYAAAAGIRTVLVGKAGDFSLEYPGHSATGPRWFLMMVTPLKNDHVHGAVVMHVDITERKRAEEATRESDERFAGAFEQAPIGVALVRPDGRWLRVNRALCDLVGYTGAELTARTFQDITHPDDLAKDLEQVRRMLAGEIRTYQLEKRFLHARGHAVTVLINVSLVHDSQGQPSYFITQIQDISDRKQAEAARLQQQTEVRVLLDLMPAMIVFKGTDNVFRRVNRRFAESLGKSVADLEGKSSVEIFAGAATAYDADDLKVIQSGQPEMGVVKPGRDRAGRVVWRQIDKVPVPDSEGNPDGLIIMVQDITERTRSEEALRRSEADLRFLNALGEATRMLAGPEEIMTASARLLGEHLRVSRCAYADVNDNGDQFTIVHDYTDGCASTVGNYRLSLFGSRAVAALSSGQTLIIHDVDAELLPGDGADMFRALGIKSIITCPLVKEGVLRAMMAVHQTSRRDWQPGEITLVQEVVARCWATIGRRAAEDNLRKSEQRFKALFEQAAMGVAQTDAVTGRYLQVNRRFAEIVGRSPEELAQLTFAEITHSQDVAHSLEMTRRLQAGTLREYTEEKRYVRAGRADVWANVTVSAMWNAGEKPDFFIVVAQDITQRKQLEDQLRQAHKMEAIGTLAGGIAHDFNNILSAIGGYTELARLKLTDNPGVRGHLDSVVQAVKRAADLVRQILTFSQDQPLERRVIPLQPVVTECVSLLRANMPATIELTLVVAADVPAVFADETQVHQILMNLVTNARHALEGRSGRIGVKAERCVVDAAHAAAQSQLRPGLYARVSVTDTGSGMAPETLRRIFEPFFTTKAAGKGTGLGLAVVHGIMDSHEGVITVYSQPGEGTVFHLYFPAHAATAAHAPHEETPDLPGRGERVLFVDDEALLVQLGEHSLRLLGYEVEVRRDPAAALTLVRADPSRFALVITDQAMPGMTGLQLAAELRQIRPDLPIILTTGYNLTLTAERVKAAGIHQLLLKPTTIQSLGAAVHAALSGQPLTTHASNPPY